MTWLLLRDFFLLYLFMVIFTYAKG